MSAQQCHTLYSLQLVHCYSTPLTTAVAAIATATAAAGQLDQAVGPSYGHTTEHTVWPQEHCHECGLEQEWQLAAEC
jgi:hypothetical protein